MANFIPNPELYAKMKVPFESEQKLNESIEGFFKELTQLREKYKIENVVCYLSGKVMDEKKEASAFITGQFYGNINYEETIIEYAQRQAIKGSIIRELEKK